MKNFFANISSHINEDKLFLFSNILFWFTIFIIFFTNGISSLDPDFAWHLRVGQDIVQTKQVPHIEEYVFPTLGERWVDHEWLSNLLLFVIYDFFGKYGYWALSLLLPGIATLTLLLISKINRSYFLKNIPRWQFFFFNSLMVSIILYALLRVFGIRLQVITWLFFTLCFYLYFKVSKDKKPSYLPFFPLLLLVWANLHGTYVMGLAVALSLLGWLFLTTKHKTRLFVFSVITTLSTLLTPYGIQLWKLIVGEYLQNTSYLLSISEWLPLYAAPNIEWYISLYISFVLALLTIGFVGKFIPLNRNFLLYLFFVLLMLVFSVKARRFTPLFTLSSFPLCTFILIKAFSHVSISKLVGIVVYIVTIPLILFQIYYISTVPLDLFTQNTSYSPYGGFMFLKEHPSLHQHQIYNQYSWGGYFTWMWQEKLIFIDGRMPQKPLGNGISFIDEYLAFRLEEHMPQKKLEKYDIKIVFTRNNIKPKDSIPKKEQFLLKHLFSIEMKDLEKEDYLISYLEKNWKVLYHDDFGTIFAHPSVILN